MTIGSGDIASPSVFALAAAGNAANPMTQRLAIKHLIAHLPASFTNGFSIHSSTSPLTDRLPKGIGAAPIPA
jgi:hypothetical protein